MIDKGHMGSFNGLRVFEDNNIDNPILSDVVVFKNGRAVTEKVVTVPEGYDFSEMYSVKIIFR